MTRTKSRKSKTLAKIYPPSDPCTCEICIGYCQRPGWWTVEQAARAIDAGYAHRMMLELAPELTFAVLSPAFLGCEGTIATNQFKHTGCNFLIEDRCELYGSGYQPLECRFCHHERHGMGPKCHSALEKDWNTPAGQALVRRWLREVSLSPGSLLMNELKVYGNKITCLPIHR